MPWRMSGVLVGRAEPISRCMLVGCPGRIFPTGFKAGPAICRACRTQDSDAGRLRAGAQDFLGIHTIGRSIGHRELPLGLPLQDYKSNKAR